MDNLETIINNLVVVLQALEGPKTVCLNEREYLEKESERAQRSFSDQEIGIQLNRLIRSAVSDVVSAADQMVSASEEIKRIMLSCSK